MKRSVIIFAISAILPLICSEIYSQERITLDESYKGKDDITTEVLQCDAYAYRVRVKVRSLNDEVIANESGNFHRLSFGLDGYLLTAGEPSLPLYTRHIAIPTGATLSASLTEEHWTEVDMGMVWPAQGPFAYSSTSPEFKINRQIYKKAFVPERIHIGKEMEWRGVRNVSLSVCPFDYHPDKGRLSVMSEFVLHIEFIYGQKNTTNGEQEASDLYRLFDNGIPMEQSQTGNPRSTTNIGESFPNGRLLIIVGSGLNNIKNSAKMSEFIKWKAFKGYESRLVSMTDIGTTESEIKSYISQKYSTDNVRYVLLVGDYDRVPMGQIISPFTGQTVLGDYWYGCLGGNNDYQADVPIGRFSTNTLSEFSNMVDKSIGYERKLRPSIKAVLMANQEGAMSNDSTGNNANYQSCCYAIKNYTYTEPVSFVKEFGADFNNGGTNATNASVLNQINQGAHIVNYRGHGGLTFWGGSAWADSIWNAAGEIFKSTEINNINDTATAIYFSVACNTGNIAASGTSDCMLETFTRAENGAVAFIGSVYSTETSANNTYDKFLFRKLQDEGVYKLGDLNVASHIANINLYDDTLGVHNAYSYICGGDPTLELWSAVPQKIENVGITVGDNTVTIQTGLTGSCYISIVSSTGSLYGVSVSTDASSSAIVRPPGNFYVVINKHNYIPHIAYFDFTSNYVQNKTFDYNATYNATPITVGECVYFDESEGPVTIKSGNKLTLKKGTQGVTIEDSFECELGASFEIQ